MKNSDSWGLEFKSTVTENSVTFFSNFVESNIRFLSGEGPTTVQTPQCYVDQTDGLNWTVQFIYIAPIANKCRLGSLYETDVWLKEIRLLFSTDKCSLHVWMSIKRSYQGIFVKI